MRHQIARTLPSRLGGHPEFQVTLAVVAPYTVPVMNILGRQQWAAEHLRHYKSVFRNAAALSSIWMLLSRHENVAFVINRFVVSLQMPRRVLRRISVSSLSVIARRTKPARYNSI
jgi:hypothetical protein